MPSSTTSPPQVRERPLAYEGFKGIDSSRDIRSMETGREQHLTRCENATCDWRGQIEVDPPADQLANAYPIFHARHLSRDIVVYAERVNGGVHLNSTREHRRALAYAKGSPVTSAIFNRRALVFAPAQTNFIYDGAVWRPNPSKLLARSPAAFGVAVSRRLCVSGFLDMDTRIAISRVDREDVFAEDEAASEQSVLRGGFIDIANILNSGDYITGLAAFEQDRLAVFTQDRVLVYAVSPDITAWALDSRINIQIGCLSHNTICQAGGDIIFCSRSGVHTFRRSVDNGITVTTASISEKVSNLYRDLVRSVADPALISAVYDRDEALYHIFFPQPDGQTCLRLTCTVPPTPESEARWSTGTFLNAQCGSFLAGSMVLGSPDGLFQTRKREELTAAFQAQATIETPFLWHGDLSNTKDSRSLVIQASGAGFIDVAAIDDEGRTFHADTVEIEAGADDALFRGVPLTRQYERRFEHRYRGVRFRFVLRGRGQLRLVGFAVKLRRT